MCWKHSLCPWDVGGTASLRRTSLGRTGPLVPQYFTSFLSCLPPRKSSRKKLARTAALLSFLSKCTTPRAPWGSPPSPKGAWGPSVTRWTSSSLHAVRAGAGSADVVQSRRRTDCQRAACGMGSLFKNEQKGLPRCPVVKTASFHCWGFHPWSGN